MEFGDTLAAELIDCMLRCGEFEAASWHFRERAV
jgi:hypothetical protein